MEQTLAFLAATANQADKPLSPSQPVDIGWHAFILYTREYAEFCQRVAGRFIHHVPTMTPTRRETMPNRRRYALVRLPPSGPPATR